jgi:putative Mg2+ transporter-C (MgtC) family protein
VSLSALAVQSAALAASHGQGWRQIGELLLAFALSSLIGLERQIRQKSAGLRTQAIVGTASALILLVSKYGFTDVLASGQIVLDPSRVAAQVVSGIGFLGAGLIITRHGATRGLTTAAAVWETAAIGMAAGAGLPLLALVVTALHFVIVLGYTPLLRLLPGALLSDRVQVTYHDGRGILRSILAECARHRWSVNGMTIDSDSTSESDAPAPQPSVSVTISLAGPNVHVATAVLAELDGVVAVQRIGDDETE